MTMDLTPQPSATPWWSVFDCCRPPSSSAADDGEQDQEGAPPCSSLKVLTGGNVVGTEWIKSHPDTPATTCADHSLDYSADTSFDSEGTGHFIGEITALTPPSSSKHISPNGKTAVTFEEADDYIGELSVSTPRSSSIPGGKKKRVSFFSDFFSDKVAITEKEQPADADCSENADEMSDPDMNPEYWYAAPDGLDENTSPMKMEEEDSSDAGNDSYDHVPDMDASDPGHGMNDNNGSSMDSAKFKQATSDQIEVKFYQFILAMMLRHLFGSWIPGQRDPATNLFDPKLLLTQSGNGGEKKDFRRMMKLRKLEYNDDKCEVFPQLKREEGSLGELAMIDE